MLTKRTDIWIRRCLPLLIVLCIFLLAPTPSHGQSYRPQLLILHSYHQGYRWTDDISRGVADALREAGVKANIHYDYMDAKRATGPRYFRLLYELYRIKYHTIHFDAVISSDRDAFNFLQQYRDQLFPGTPQIFCGVYNFTPSMLHDARLITGVNEAAEFKPTLDLALKLHPKTRQIVIVNDTTTTGQAVHNDILRVIPPYQNRLKFSFLENLTMPQLLATLPTLPPDSLVLYTLFFRDSSQRVFDYDESMLMIASRCPVPIYGTWDFNLGLGIVGGKLISGYYQGKTAGQMAVRVLQGENVERIPIVMASHDRYMFDYRQLRRFGIDVSTLPPQSIIIDRPSTVYTMKRTVFWSGIVAFTALLGVVVLLALNIKARVAAEKELRELTGELEGRVASRTDALRRQNEELQQTYEELQTETEQKFKAMEELREKERLLIQQSRMAAVGEMLGNIAHQWRQPLNVLGLNIQEVTISQRQGVLTPEVLTSNLKKAMEIVLHMSHTIDDFRIFSTPDTEKIPFSIKEVVSRTTALLEDNFRTQGIVIEVLCEGEPQCLGYPNGYGQVILNLLVNARDAIQDAGVKEGLITLHAWEEEGKSILSVADNGGGIAPAIMDKIFDAYFTTKEIGKGTGIGLFMSKAIIEKSMGGRLAVRNSGKGAEFWIEVPALREETTT